MGNSGVELIENIADCIIELSNKKVIKKVETIAKKFGLHAVAISKYIQIMRMLKQDQPPTERRIQLIKDHYRKNSTFREKIDKALELWGGPYGRRVDQTAQLRLLITQNPALSVRELSETLKVYKDAIWQMLSTIEDSDKLENKKITAKWRAYQEGGHALLKKVEQAPGTKYLWLVRSIRARSQIKQQRHEDVDVLFRRLITYCKEYKDEELREILLAHKKAGGYWPKKS